MKIFKKIYVRCMVLFVCALTVTCARIQALEIVQTQPRVSLAFLPTPLHELSRVTVDLQGPTVLIKRDDQTGLGMGGNKTRKLEFLIADALAQGCDVVISMGAIQSNHVRQVAAACAQYGLACELLLRSKKPDQLQSNNLLNQLFGARMYWTKEEGSPQTLEELADDLRTQGKKPYVIPVGGSNAIGALGYAQAMVEIMQQLKERNQEVSHIVVASGSAGTVSGLVVGAYLAGFTGNIIGMSIDGIVDLTQPAEIIDVQKRAFIQRHVMLANDVSSYLHLDKICTAEDFTIIFDYVADYAVMGDLEKNAITYLASKEGILLDPVYTSRAFGGLLDMIKKGYFTKDDTVLFIHTGGTPALFAYAEDFTATI